jgi:hypothetical protein
VNGRERIEKAARAHGYTDEPEPGGDSPRHVRRYSNGARHITVDYNLGGMVTKAWTADRRLGPWAARKAECVINYFKGVELWTK